MLSLVIPSLPSDAWIVALAGVTLVINELRLLEPSSFTVIVYSYLPSFASAVTVTSELANALGAIVNVLSKSKLLLIFTLIVLDFRPADTGTTVKLTWLLFLVIPSLPSVVLIVALAGVTLVINELRLSEPVSFTVIVYAYSPLVSVAVTDKSDLAKALGAIVNVSLKSKLLLIFTLIVLDFKPAAPGTKVKLTVLLSLVIPSLPSDAWIVALTGVTLVINVLRLLEPSSFTVIVYSYLPSFASAVTVKSELANALGVIVNTESSPVETCLINSSLLLNFKLTTCSISFWATGANVAVILLSVSL